MRRGLKQYYNCVSDDTDFEAARAAPYEKGTETSSTHPRRARRTWAARAAPYEKGTETRQLWNRRRSRNRAARAAPYEKGTETSHGRRRIPDQAKSRARGPL